MDKEMTATKWAADPQVHLVYEMLCDTTEPPEGRHWEGWIAEKIVIALRASFKADLDCELFEDREK